MTTDAASRIGGQGWVTEEDLNRFSNQANLILWLLRDGKWGDKWWLERYSGSQRVGARIWELREVFDIESKRGPGGTAMYRLVGRRETPRSRPRHCATCTCGGE